MNALNQIVCLTCGTTYANDAAFTSAHPGPYAAEALASAKTSAPIVNCANCPTYVISKARASATGLQ